MRRVEPTGNRPVLAIAFCDVGQQELAIATWFPTGIFNGFQDKGTVVFDSLRNSVVEVVRCF
jgi:hypothetical protein